MDRKDVTTKVLEGDFYRIQIHSVQSAAPDSSKQVLLTPQVAESLTGPALIRNLHLIGR